MNIRIDGPGVSRADSPVTLPGPATPTSENQPPSRHVDLKNANVASSRFIRRNLI